MVEGRVRGRSRLPADKGTPGHDQSQRTLLNQLSHVGAWFFLFFVFCFSSCCFFSPFFFLFSFWDGGKNELECCALSLFHHNPPDHLWPELFPHSIYLKLLSTFRKRDRHIDSERDWERENREGENRMSWKFAQA